MELRYILNGYGISADTIPISHTGTVKASHAHAVSPRTIPLCYSNNSHIVFKFDTECLFQLI